MGCIHIYTGDGKGKTSAALGLALRAAGHQKKVLIARFLKDNHSGELEVLRQLSQIALVPNEEEFGFVFQMNSAEKIMAKHYYTQMFHNAATTANTGLFDVLVLDEVLDACNLDMVPAELVLNFLKKKPEKLEVVLTGRNPNPEFLELADYVSDIQKKKHPFDTGIQARPGIEY